MKDAKQLRQFLKYTTRYLVEKATKYELSQTNISSEY